MGIAKHNVYLQKENNRCALRKEYKIKWHKLQSSGCRMREQVQGTVIHRG